MDKEQEIRERIGKIIDSINSTGKKVRIIAASKTFGVEEIAIARESGITDLGENYLNELERKAGNSELAGISWHFIGNLQSNKVRGLAGIPDLKAIHTVASRNAIEEIAKRFGKKPMLLVEVNVGKEDNKAGVDPGQARELIGFAIETGLGISGLMCIPPFSDNPEGLRPYFQKLRELRDSLEDKLGITLPELSMGMSHDYLVAIEEGATMVRIGSAIFGERAKRI